MPKSLTQCVNHIGIEWQPQEVVQEDGDDHLGRIGHVPRQLLHATPSHYVRVGYIDHRNAEDNRDTNRLPLKVTEEGNDLELKRFKTL